MRVVCRLSGILIFIALNIFAATPATAEELAVDPKVVLAIANDLDGVVGDTVDEGSWNADIKRDATGMPNAFKCQVTKMSRKQQRYTCDFDFDVTPYEGEDLGDPWESTCTAVKYVVKGTVGSRSFSIASDEDSIQSCLESLNESN